MPAATAASPRWSSRTMRGIFLPTCPNNKRQAACMGMQTSRPVWRMSSEALCGPVIDFLPSRVPWPARTPFRPSGSRTAAPGGVLSSVRKPAHPSGFPRGQTLCFLKTRSAYPGGSWVGKTGRRRTCPAPGCVSQPVLMYS